MRTNLSKATSRMGALAEEKSDISLWPTSNGWGLGS